MTAYDDDGWFAIFHAYQVTQLTWTWYQQYNDDWACLNEQATFANGQRKTITQIDEQELYEAIWEISAATSYDGLFTGQLGVFRLDVATRTLCKIADVGDWERDAYDPTTGPYLPSIQPLPADQQPCGTI
ncbi:MAG: hypothetical protein MI924_13940 [Chloroflexales bacterium]|nr:hypothetical protein [Chloroflexales bacterium]